MQTASGSDNRRRRPLRGALGPVVPVRMASGLAKRLIILMLATVLSTGAALFTGITPASATNFCSTNGGYTDAVACYSGRFQYQVYAVMTVPYENISPYPPPNGVGLIGQTLQAFIGSPCTVAAIRTGEMFHYNLYPGDYGNYSIFQQDYDGGGEIRILIGASPGISHQYEYSFYTNSVIGTIDGYQYGPTVTGVGNLACITEVGLIMDKTSGLPTNEYGAGTTSYSGSIYSPGPVSTSTWPGARVDLPCAPGQTFNCYNFSFYNGQTTFQNNKI